MNVKGKINLFIIKLKLNSINHFQMGTIAKISILSNVSLRTVDKIPALDLEEGDIDVSHFGCVCVCVCVVCVCVCARARVFYLWVSVQPQPTKSSAKQLPLLAARSGDEPGAHALVTRIRVYVCVCVRACVRVCVIHNYTCVTPLLT